MAPLNSAISPLLKTRIACKYSLTSRLPFVTSHIVCQPLSLHSPKLQPAGATDPPFVAQGPGPRRTVKQRAQAPPTPTPTAGEDPQYLIPFSNTKLCKAFRDPENRLGCCPIPRRPENTGEAHTTLALSPRATYTQTTTPPPPMSKVPLAPDRAARTRRKQPSSPPSNKLRVW